jgi:two-component system sensor histidine kinase KdpD
MRSTWIESETARWRLLWPGLVVWALGWAAMFALDGKVDLSNLALLLVLVASVAALWLPAWLSWLASALAVMAFNWWFVPPRGTFRVDLRQDALLLVAMLVVTWIVAALMAVQRRQAHRLARTAARAEQLRQWVETLRDAPDPLAHVGSLQQALHDLTGLGAVVLALRDTLPKDNDEQHAVRAGEADAEQLAALWHCLRQGRPMGPGTRYHQELDAWLLPLRGRAASFGAAALSEVERDDPVLREHAQALCDQLGIALQRAQAARAEQRAREEAQTQSVRNALLAAISHDYRTPLATITGAASSMVEQADRLGQEQRARLARTILDETSRLSRLTDNTLQLARLDAPGVTLRCDWESAEELVGSVMRRARAKSPHRVLRARLEPELPLLWCDAMLLSQLLDNLLDNAIKYSPDDSPIELLVRRQEDKLILAVRDRGSGIAPAWRERVFDAFHRGAEAMPGAADAAPRASASGAGVGLAVCRAIARVHGGELRLRARAHGGSSFECVLPIRESPPRPPQEAAAP